MTAAVSNRVPRGFPGLERIMAFLTLADELHFSRAARHLHISQPALSQQIAAFEREIGLTLFRRSTRSVDLTEAGMRLLDVVRPAVEHLTTGLREVQRLVSLAARTVTVSHSGWGTGEVIAQAARALSDRLPEFQVLPRYGSVAEQVRALVDGDADVGLLWRSPDAPPMSGLDAQSCARVPLCLAVPDGHRLAEAGRVDIGELAGETLVQLSGAIQPEPDALVTAIGLALAAKYVVETSQDVYTAVSAGIGVALCPYPALREHPHRSIRFVPVPDATAALLITRPVGVTGNVPAAVLEELRAAAGRLSRATEL